jgi:jumonji domain-containing protein 7
MCCLLHYLLIVVCLLAEMDPGDMLFVPSYWWHEVVSTPGTIQNFNLEGTLADSYVHLNVAINHWFDPLFLKEYPCAVCRKYPNKKYGYALLDLVTGTSTPHN